MIRLTAVLLVILSVSVRGMDIVAITNGGTQSECLNGTTHHCMRIFSDMPEKIFNSDNVELRICSSLIVRQNITFKRVKHLIVVGYGAPIIKCSDSFPSAFTVVEVLNLELENLVFSNCVFVLSPSTFISIHNIKFKGQHNSTLSIQNAVSLPNTPKDIQLCSWNNFVGARKPELQLPLEPHLTEATNTFCPPGFVHDKSSGNKSAKCVLSPSEYQGIRKCKESSNREACWSGGYWIGYDMDKVESEDTLLFGYCPFTFCSSKIHHKLPSVANKQNLSAIICSDSHLGTLCGKCKPGFSVYYHSLDFKCKRNKLCEWGWVFFILSEIIPVSFIFIAIIGFNISFTSGLLNGFIFYCQAVLMLQLTAHGFISFPNTINFLYRVHYFVFLSFGLDPFVLDEISYCIWKGTNALDVLVFSYITLAYAFILIVSIIFCVKRSTNCCVKCRFSNSQRVKYQSNIIHGLSAFLVLFFAHAVRASMLLLSPTKIYSKGMKYNRTAVTYEGDMLYLSAQHIPYAIPAIVILFMASIPLIVLTIYPLHYRIFAVLGVAESRCVNIMFKPLEKIRPFLDSFQGCFKDNCRFFSGLYFVYRLLFLLNMINIELEDTYFYIMLQLSIMLMLHAVFQPYRKRLHNILDSLLFGDLSIINAIASYVYSRRDGSFGAYVSALLWIQVVLVFLPLLVLLVCVIVKRLPLHKKCRKRYSFFIQLPSGPEQEDPKPASVCMSYGSLDRTVCTY